MKIIIALVFTAVLSPVVFSQQAALLQEKLSDQAPAAAGVRAGGGQVLGEDMQIITQTIPPGPAAGVPASAAGFTVNKKHTVKKGDTLWWLSMKYYKNPFKWGKIYNANLNSISNPDVIYPDNEIEIPEITEEISPAASEDVSINSDETQKEPELSSTEIINEQPASAASAALKPEESASQPAAGISAMPGEKLPEFTKTGLLSEEMPVDQKEWGSGFEIAPLGWLADGEIAGKDSGQDVIADSFSISGEIVIIKMRAPGLLKKGDILRAYLRGAPAYSKAGKKTGFELQHAGTLEVVSADGALARAVVTDAFTSIKKGMPIKKK